MSAATATPEQDTLRDSRDDLDGAAGTSPLDCAPDIVSDEPTRPRFRVQPGIVGITALLAVLGWVLYGAEVSAGAWDHGAASYVAIFTVALMGLIAVHEAGHVVAGMALGQRLVSVRIGAKFGVTMLGDNTPRSMALIAAAGPAIGTVASVAVLAATPMPFSPLWAAGFVALIENVANVVLFFMAGSDGSKIVSAMKHSCDSHTVSPAPAT